jgi:chromosome segregation ATPase
MTARREVPLTTDTLAWVHNELAEIKSRLAVAQQAAEHSRGVAADAAEKALQTRQKVDQFDGIGPVLMVLQDDVRAVREQVARAVDEINSLRQSREEVERRVAGDSERIRQDRNDAVHHFDELQREIAGWQERITSYEEHNRRNLELSAHLIQRLESLEGQIENTETVHSRSYGAVNRIDNEIQHMAALFPAIEREDEAQRERINTIFETLRRLEIEIETVKTESNRIGRLDDRLELVQAERTRHNERLAEITAQLTKMESRVNEQGERATLIEVRIANYLEELRRLKDRLQSDRDQISGYLHSLMELEADMRKRQIIALEKEIRDVRGRALNFAED